MWSGDFSLKPKTTEDLVQEKTVFAQEKSHRDNLDFEIRTLRREEAKLETERNALVSKQNDEANKEKFHQFKKEFSTQEAITLAVSDDD